MGSEEKSTTWVGNICKKVGTFCPAIDTIISQESLQYAETQFLTAGENVKQFTGNQLLTAGANVKQFCSEFMQEVLPEFLKDSFLEAAQSEETEKCDSLSFEVLKKDDDEGHKVEFSKSKSCDGISASGFSTVRKEMSLEQNHRKVTLIPSEISQVEALKKNDVGMKPSVCGVNHSHHGGIEEQIDLHSPKSVLSQPSYDSAKAGGTAELDASKVDSLTLHHYAIVSAAFDESKILGNKDDSTDGPGDGKAAQAKDNHASETGMDSTEPFNVLTMDPDCPVLYRNRICAASDFTTEDPAFRAMDNFPLKVKFEKGWEFIQMAGYEDHDVESDQPRGKTFKSNNHSESCESDWEIV